MDHHYDIAIIGLGCAGSHVALELLRQQPDLKLLVIDNAPTGVAKKWSYWEQGIGKWDHLILKKWNHGVFKSEQGSIELDLKPYAYKTMDSGVFFAFAKAELLKHSNSTYIHASVKHVTQNNNDLKLIEHTDGKSLAKLVLDSRIEPVFFTDKHAITLQQHFKGWTIETASDSFNANSFTMMDYTLRDHGTTSFTYVLPYSATSALIEFTYFSPALVDDHIYDDFLKKYIAETLKISDYKIVEVEKGVIPMTTYDFAQHNSQYVFKIGTAGGWVKPSTGYSFKMTEKKAVTLVHNYSNGLPLITDLFPKRFRIYDKTMLHVLHEFNEDGPAFFYRLYAHNKIQNLFKFLDEETQLVEEISIMQSMTSMRMIKSFFKNLLQHPKV